MVIPETLVQIGIATGVVALVGDRLIERINQWLTPRAEYITGTLDVVHSAVSRLSDVLLAATTALDDGAITREELETLQAIVARIYRHEAKQLDSSSQDSENV